MGVSAGSSYGARLLAEQPEKMPFKAFVSLCNPFNLGSVTYHMDKSFLGKNLSRAITIRAKKIIKYHKKNPIMMEYLKSKKVDLNKL